MPNSTIAAWCLDHSRGARSLAGAMLLGVVIEAPAVAAEPPWRLPPVEPTAGRLVAGPMGPSVLLRDEAFSEFELASMSNQVDQPLLSPPAEAIVDDQRPPGAKKGMLQDVTFNATWLPAPNTDDLGATDLAISTTLGVPFPTVRTPLLIIPAFEFHLLDGPQSPDLPSKLYDAEIEFRWILPVGDCWTMIVGAAPGAHGDYQLDDEETLRITGRAIAAYKWSEQTTFVLGVLYLDRPDLDILPAGGVMWNPSDDWRLELLFPRPRIYGRFWCSETAGGWTDEWWWYVGGEFGSGVWAIEMPQGVPDVATLSDWRVMLGLEHKIIGLLTTRAELGYVFNRQIEFVGPTPTYEPADTFMLRLGASY